MTKNKVWKNEEENKTWKSNFIRSKIPLKTITWRREIKKETKEEPGRIINSFVSERTVSTYILRPNVRYDVRYFCWRWRFIKTRDAELEFDSYIISLIENPKWNQLNTSHDWSAQNVLMTQYRGRIQEKKIYKCQRFGLRKTPLWFLSKTFQDGHKELFIWGSNTFGR